MDADFSRMWQALPGAVYDSSTQMLHLETSFAPLVYKDTIYVRDCYNRLTKMALGMTPRKLSSGELGAHFTGRSVH